MRYSCFVLACALVCYSQAAVLRLVDKPVFQTSVSHYSTNRFAINSFTQDTKQLLPFAPKETPQQPAPEELSAPEKQPTAEDEQPAPQEQPASIEQPQEQPAALEDSSSETHSAAALLPVEEEQPEVVEVAPAPQEQPIQQELPSAEALPNQQELLAPQLQMPTQELLAPIELPAPKRMPAATPRDELVLNNKNNINPDGTYDYAYETSNGIVVSARSLGDGAVEGSYSYFSPDGEEIRITYYADKFGFHAVGEPVPKTPEHVLRGLEYIKDHPFEVIDKNTGMTMQADIESKVEVFTKRATAKPEHIGNYKYDGSDA